MQLDDEWLTKIQIVVGQDNPHEEVNQCFAFDLKVIVTGLSRLDRGC